MLTSTNILSDDSTYLMEEWDFDRNNQIGVFPDQVSRHSNKKVWWKCKKCGHCWQTSIANRTRGTSCPKCAQELRNAKKRRAQKGVDDLATLFPEIAKTWNYERLDEVNISSDIEALFVRYDKSRIEEEKDNLKK